MGRLFTIGLCWLVMCGGNATASTWLELTRNNAVWFYAPTDCRQSGNADGSLRATGNYDFVRSWQWSGGISSEDPRLKTLRWPGDLFGYTLHVVEQQTASREIKTWLLRAKDGLGSDLRLPYAGQAPQPLAYRVGPPFGQSGAITAPSSITTCGFLVRVAWSADTNRPYWISTDLLRPVARTDAENTITLAEAFITLVWVALLFGFLFLPFGFFDIDDWQVSQVRSRTIVRYLVFCAIGGAGLWLAHHIFLQEPYLQILKAQSYYAFYDHLPKANGLLKPLSIFDAQRLFVGPPRPEELLTNPQVFWFACLGVVGMMVFTFGMRIYKGWYWIFVPLPLAVRFKRAMWRGAWPTADDIIDSIREGTLHKTTWQSKAMTKKADRLTQELVARRNAFERRMMA
jgi:hypothetical protein